MLARCRQIARRVEFVDKLSIAAAAVDEPTPSAEQTIPAESTIDGETTTPGEPIPSAEQAIPVKTTPPALMNYAQHITKCISD
ncbi:hypothetical protein V493_02321 [Pseudogymnoascus sp. VKM F-4281 (FW-2241)]|nr:hypothetical protein V493_02321 [Pseudogymnoascus sp. VKM F-4281 (FW-2241)]